MAANATLMVDVRADTTAATKGLDDTTKAMDRMGREARTASDRIDSVGGTASGTTTGLRDMADAVEMIGFPGLAAGMGTAAVGFEAIDGATTLYATHSAMLSKVLGGVTKAMNLLKVSILTNPIFIIAAILIAIVAAFVLLYTKCEGFRKVVNAVFGFVWNLIKGFWNWIKTAFGALLDILAKPFNFVLGIVKSVFATLSNVIRGAIDGVKNIFKGLTDFVRRIFDTISDVFSGVFEAIKAPFKKAIDWIKDHFKLPSLPSWLPGVGKAAPAVAIPAARYGGGARAGTAGSAITININGPIDPHSTVRQLRRLFREDQERLGRTATIRPALA